MMPTSTDSSLPHGIKIEFLTVLIIQIHKPRLAKTNKGKKKKVYIHKSIRDGFWKVKIATYRVIIGRNGDEIGRS